jgi:hypothetical protein
MDTDYSASEAIEIEATDVTHLPDDGVVVPTGSERPGLDLVNEHPFLAVGAAMAAGYILGRTLRWV